MKSNVATAYLQARSQLMGRLSDIEVELAEIRKALGLVGGAALPAPTGGAKRGPKPGGKRRKLRPRGTGLRAILKHLDTKGPAKPKDVAASTGITYATVSNTLSTLRGKKLVARSDKGWTLTPAGKTDLAKREKGA
jgi:hypothetical protein